MHKLLVAGFLLAALLAGCSGNGGTDDLPDDLAQAADDLDLEATATTGVIRGVVVNEAIAPLAGVVVVLKLSDGERETTTAETGAFGFDGLEPGNYFLTARKLGYFDTQQSVEVEAGVAEPQAIKVLLAANPSELPSFSILQFQGYMECSAVAGTPVSGGFFTPCEIPTQGPIGNENSHTTFTFEGNISWIHTNMIWEETNPLAAELYYNIFYPPYEIVGFSRGASPLVNDIDEGNVTGFNENQEIDFEAAASRSTTQGFVGAAYQQKFDVFIVIFYNFLPPEDYQFWRDGEPKIPR